jgi:hypothetical protein
MLSNAYKIKQGQLNMTILAIHTGEGMTKDMYENVRKEVTWEGNPPPGMIFMRRHLMTLASLVLQRFGNQRINGTIS